MSLILGGSGLPLRYKISFLAGFSPGGVALEFFASLKDQGWYQGIASAMPKVALLSIAP